MAVSANQGVGYSHLFYHQLDSQDGQSSRYSSSTRDYDPIRHSFIPLSCQSHKYSMQREGMQKGYNPKDKLYFGNQLMSSLQASGSSRFDPNKRYSKDDNLSRADSSYKSNSNSNRAYYH